MGNMTNHGMTHGTTATHPRPIREDVSDKTAGGAWTPMFWLFQKPEFLRYHWFVAAVGRIKKT